MSDRDPGAEREHQTIEPNIPDIPEYDAPTLEGLRQAETESKTSQELRELEQKIPQKSKYKSFEKMGILLVRNEVLNNRLKGLYKDQRRRMSEKSQIEDGANDAAENETAEVEEKVLELESKEIQGIMHDLDSLTAEIKNLEPLAIKQGEEFLEQMLAIQKEFERLRREKRKELKMAEIEKIEEILELIKMNFIPEINEVLVPLKNNEDTIDMSGDTKEEKIETANTVAADDADSESVLTGTEHTLPSLENRREVMKNYLKTLEAERKLDEKDRRRLDPDISSDAELDKEIARFKKMIGDTEDQIRSIKPEDLETNFPLQEAA